MRHLILYCRAGFEAECAAEIQSEARARLRTGRIDYLQAIAGSGFVVASLDSTEASLTLWQKLDFHTLIFARQLLVSSGLLSELPAHDRLTPLLAAVKLLAARFSDVWLETADTNAAKELSTFCRKFATPLRNALETQGLLALNDPSLPRLHLFFQASTAVYPALSDPALAAPWLMGIPRLKLARAAPSRAALKLEEAFHTFFGPAERNRCLRPGMRAVDLGAAPGGWTWLLAQHHLRVTAVDNGALLPELLESGLVEHIRTDGFRYRPPRPVDWMVCDIVEQPSRIAKLVSDWLRRDDCRYCIFNLKLPMKKRYEEVRRCQSMIREGCWEAGDFRLAFKQLYHDRAEVTGFAARASASARRG